MEKQIYCFSEDHKEIDAISFCPQCSIYMCNKCDNTHSSFFKNHKTYNIYKEDEFFTGFCKEEGHVSKLNYFCKNHNILCCGLCIAKINEIGDGQHKDCDVCIIQNIKEEKKNKLKDNLKCLEDLQDRFNESLESLKEIFQNIEKDRENLKLDIQNVFTKIRNILNNREDELLLEVDNLFNSNYIGEDIIKKGEKLPKQIKLSLEKGKKIEKEWDDNNLYSNINDCINIENNINNINIINEKIKKFNIRNYKFKMKFIPKDIQLDNFLEKIKSFGSVYYNNYSFRNCPINIKKERKFIISGKYNNIITKKESNNYYGGTICENELDKSIEEHKWKIKVLKTNKYNFMVGISTSDFDPNKSNYDTCGWFLDCSTSPPTLYSGPPFGYKGKKTNLSNLENEIVVVMNMKKKSLKFIINNEDKGDSYIGIPIDKPLFPAILLMNVDDSVEINDFN